MQNDSDMSQTDSLDFRSPLPYPLD